MCCIRIDAGAFYFRQGIMPLKRSAAAKNPVCSFYLTGRLYREVVFLLHQPGLFDQMGQDGGNDCNSDTCGYDEQGCDKEKDMQRVGQKQHQYTDQTICGIDQGKAADVLQRFCIFMAEGIVLSDLDADLPELVERQIAGDGADPDHDQV